LHNAPSSTSNPSSQKTPFQTTNHPKRKNLIYTQKQQQNHQLLLLHKIIIIIIIIMNSCCLLPSLSLSPSQTYQRVDLAATNSGTSTTVSPPVIRFSHRHKHEQQRQQGQAAY
jgi:hypothetical protein